MDSYYIKFTFKTKLIIIINHYIIKKNKNEYTKHVTQVHCDPYRNESRFLEI